MRCWSIRWCNKKMAVRFLTAGERNYECICKLPDFMIMSNNKKVHKISGIEILQWKIVFSRSRHNTC